MYATETVTQKTTTFGGKPVFRTLDRDGAEVQQIMGDDGAWKNAPLQLVDAIRTHYGCGPADVQPSAPEAEAPTVVTAPAPE
jgi:hypothetical protein